MGNFIFTPSKRTVSQVRKNEAKRKTDCDILCAKCKQLDNLKLNDEEIFIGGNKRKQSKTKKKRRRG